VWDGAILLAKVLEHWLGRGGLSGKRVLELGCGTGVVGLAAAALGATAVHLTDLEYVLENTRANARTNAHLFTNSPAADECSGQSDTPAQHGSSQIDAAGKCNKQSDDTPAQYSSSQIAAGECNKQADDTSVQDGSSQIASTDECNKQSHSSAQVAASECNKQNNTPAQYSSSQIALSSNVHVREYDWFESAPAVTHSDDRKGWDWVVAADVAWVEELIEPLVRTLVRVSGLAGGRTDAAEGRLGWVCVCLFVGLLVNTSRHCSKSRCV
jgi:hypothetical protein